MPKIAIHYFKHKYRDVAILSHPILTQHNKFKICFAAIYLLNRLSYSHPILLPAGTTFAPDMTSLTSSGWQLSKFKVKKTCENAESVGFAAIYLVNCLS